MPEDNFPALRKAGKKVKEASSKFWNCGFRKKYISWTRFKEKRLTWKAFLIPDRNARLRIYAYLAIGCIGTSSLWVRPNIKDLVKIACYAIEEASLPSNVYFTTKYEKAMQVSSLQRSLINHYDINKDNEIGKIEAKRLTKETGLTKKDLKARCTEGDLEKLIRAAKSQDILPERIYEDIQIKCYAEPIETMRMIKVSSAEQLAHILRENNYQKGIEEYKSQKDAMWKEANESLNQPSIAKPDYSKSETWKKGASSFYDSGKYLAGISIGYAMDPGNFFDNLKETIKNPYVFWGFDNELPDDMPKE